MFAVIEGIDGSGKTTILEALKGDPFFASWEFLREPTDGPFGKKIREIISQSDRVYSRQTRNELTDLFIQDRIWDNENNIMPLIKKKKNILSDRYYISTAAYQGMDRKEVLKILVEQMENPLILNPDFIFFLNIDVATSLDRIRKRNTQKEIFEKKDSLLRIFNNYLIIEDYFSTSDDFQITDMPQWITIDARNPVNKILEEIAENLRKKSDRKNP